ncbi:hypothetical protein [Actinomadura madurae]|uniref:hypothetical protein n=1 Tax=Actinomadura madurae TaxID=1993 RepID=UPI0020D2533E|nr:hypothetical protein [Actinomadura madurae]MCP9977709.1 hypothetical protein [Actinomadura madurae]
MNSASTQRVRAATTAAAGVPVAVAAQAVHAAPSTANITSPQARARRASVPEDGRSPGPSGAKAGEASENASSSRRARPSPPGAAGVAVASEKATSNLRQP